MDYHATANIPPSYSSPLTRLSWTMRCTILYEASNTVLTTRQRNALERFSALNGCSTDRSHQYGGSRYCDGFDHHVHNGLVRRLPPGQARLPRRRARRRVGAPGSALTGAIAGAPTRLPRATRATRAIRVVGTNRRLHWLHPANAQRIFERENTGNDGK